MKTSLRPTATKCNPLPKFKQKCWSGRIKSHIKLSNVENSCAVKFQFPIYRFLSDEDYCLAGNSPSQLELEAKYDFHFPLTLAMSRSRTDPLFNGLKIHITKSVQPPPDQMYQIISVGGGKPLINLPKNKDKRRWTNVVVVTNREDVGSCSQAYKVN